MLMWSVVRILYARPDSVVSSFMDRWPCGMLMWSVVRILSARPVVSSHK